MSTSTLRFSLQSGIALTALLLHLPALGQDRGMAEAAPVTGSIDNPTTNADIVVTAQRRSERLENVPISIAVASAEQLERSGIRSIHDIAQITPGVSVTRANSSTSPTIRGVSSAIAGIGADPNVATYVDGFYTPSRTGAQLAAFNNIAQIEILKGPQGTLFGRNATGGALLIRTLDPSHVTAFRGDASYGRFDSRIFNAYATTGLSDNLAADVAVHIRRNDGYIKDAFTGENSAPVKETAFRTKWLLTPSDGTRFTLTFEHSKFNDMTGLNSTTFQYSLVDFRGLPNTKLPNRTSNARLISNDVETNMVSLKSEIDIGAVTLNALSSWRKQNDFFDGDVGGSPGFIIDSVYRQPETTISQEVNLTSNGQNRLNWVAGVYYYNDNSQVVDRNLLTGGIRFHAEVGVRTEAIAAFADGTYGLSDQVFLTLGARYSYEKKKFTFRSQPGATPFRDDEGWGSFTPRAALRWEFEPGSNVYASVSRGFKSGVYNGTVLAPVALSVKPETITAYEAGFKTARRRFFLSGAAYYYDYKNLQDLIILVPGAVSVLANAGAAEIYGAEMSLTLNPSSRLSIRAGAAYTHARYKNYPKAALTEPNGPILRNVMKDISGLPIPRQADWTGNIAVNYRYPTTIGTFDFNGNVYLTSDIPFTADRRLTQKGYGILNLEAGWSTPDDHLRLSVYGTNVTNTKRRISMTTFSLGDRQLFGEPIAYGVKAEIRF